MKKSALRSVSQLSEFIENGEFRYAAQQLRPTDRRQPSLRWFEWLLRPRLEDAEVSALEFIEAVESRELSLDLDMRVLRDAFLWLDRQPVNTRLSVNVSASSFANRHFCEYLVGRIERSNLMAEQLCFDINVSDAVADLSGATRFIKAMRSAGCAIALDDGVPGNPVLSLFGPLGYIDYLKIDHRWVGPAPESESHRQTLESLVDYAQRLDLEVVAEGVDNSTQLELVRSLGIRYYQGFIDGEPRIIAGVCDGELTLDLAEMSA